MPVPVPVPGRDPALGRCHVPVRTAASFNAIPTALRSHQQHESRHTQHTAAARTHTPRSQPHQTFTCNGLNLLLASVLVVVSERRARVFPPLFRTRLFQPLWVCPCERSGLSGSGTQRESRWKFQGVIVSVAVEG